MSKQNLKNNRQEHTEKQESIKTKENVGRKKIKKRRNKNTDRI